MGDVVGDHGKRFLFDADLVSVKQRIASKRQSVLKESEARRAEIAQMARVRQ